MVDDERLTLEAGITELRTRQRMVEEAIARLQDLPVQRAMVEKGVALAGADLLGAIDVEAIAGAVSRLTTIARGKARTSARRCVPERRPREYARHRYG